MRLNARDNGGPNQERILVEQTEGSFVIQRKHQTHAVAIKLEGRVRHIRIERRENKFRFEKYSKIEEQELKGLVERAMETCRSGKHMFTIDKERDESTATEPNREES